MLPTQSMVKLMIQRNCVYARCIIHPAAGRKRPSSAVAMCSCLHPRVLRSIERSLPQLSSSIQRLERWDYLLSDHLEDGTGSGIHRGPRDQRVVETRTSVLTQVKEGGVCVCMRACVRACARVHCFGWTNVSISVSKGIATCSLSFSLSLSCMKAGCKKTLYLLHHPCKIECIHSFSFSLLVQAYMYWLPDGPCSDGLFSASLYGLSAAYNPCMHGICHSSFMCSKMKAVRWRSIRLVHKQKHGKLLITCTCTHTGAPNARTHTHTHTHTHAFL